MRLSDYCSEAEWKKIKDFADGKETPFLVVDLEIISQKYDELTTCFPMAKVHYALKANPGAPVITESGTIDFGSTFNNRIHAFLEDVSNGVPKHALRASGRDALAVLELTYAAMESFELGGELVRPNPLPPLC